MSWNVPRCLIFLVILGFTMVSGCRHHPDVAVTTYHYDNLRTGWNSHEEKLTPEKIPSSHFGLLYTTVLDDLQDQVDAQPLVVPNEIITGGSSPGKYDVVYVATENNTVYAIDAASGKILLHQSMGPPVPIGGPPPIPPPPGYSCANNGFNVGITGTPVIDLASNTMYLVAYVYESGLPVYRVHALNLSDLNDRVPAVKAAASHTLTDGSTFQFYAGWQRQRPAIVETKGNIYAAFGSFCDWGGDRSRGWVLGWQTPSLTPLPTNQLNNQLPDAAAPTGMFLSSVWMSGYGVSADPSGNLYFVTGNSDSNSGGSLARNTCNSTSTPVSGKLYTTYVGAPQYSNIQSSVVSVLPDLSGVHDIFTPWILAYLDECDADFGSGGVMLLPDHHGPIPHLVAAAGKDGKMLILNRDHLGGYNVPGNTTSFGSGATDNVVALANVGACWCGPSYFESDGAYIVSSGGFNVNVWRVRTNPSVSLIHEGTSPPVTGSGDGGQDPGFFTTVSSDGEKDAIIWAISRPDSNQKLWLYAFKAKPSSGSDALPQLFAQVVGTWAWGNVNANVVPVVANGKVYVAYSQRLTVFGLK